MKRPLRILLSVYFLLFVVLGFAGCLFSSCNTLHKTSSVHREKRDSTVNKTNQEASVKKEDSSWLKDKNESIKSGTVIEFDTGRSMPFKIKRNFFAGPTAIDPTGLNTGPSEALEVTGSIIMKNGSQGVGPDNDKESPITKAIAKAIESGILKPKRVIIYTDEQHHTLDSGAVHKVDTVSKSGTENTHVVANVVDKQKEKIRKRVPVFGIIASLGLFLLIVLLSNKTTRDKVIAFFKNFIFKILKLFK